MSIVLYLYKFSIKIRRQILLEIQIHKWFRLSTAVCILYIVVQQFEITILYHSESKLCCSFQRYSTRTRIANFTQKVLRAVYICLIYVITLLSEVNRQAYLLNVTERCCFPFFYRLLGIFTTAIRVFCIYKTFVMNYPLFYLLTHKVHISM